MHLHVWFLKKRYFFMLYKIERHVGLAECVTDSYTILLVLPVSRLEIFLEIAMFRHVPSTCKLSHVAKILEFFFTSGSINFRFVIMTMVSLRLIERSSLSNIIVATATTVRGQLIRCTILQNVKYYLECSKMTSSYSEPII